MGKNLITDEELVLTLLKENNGRLNIGKIINLYSLDSRSPKIKPISDVMRTLESKLCIGMFDNKKGDWGLVEGGAKRFETPSSIEETVSTEQFEEVASDQETKI